MRRKLTLEQKYFAVVLVAAHATYPMTGHMIGRRIGYANGQPVKRVLRMMHEDGLLQARPGEYMGKPCVWFWMNNENRKITLADLQNFEEAS